MISWSTIQSLLIFFGPWLLPRAIAFYRSIRAPPTASIRPLPTRTSYALAVLFVSGLVAFFSTLPFFHPDNIFRQTQSRLQTPAGVLLTRLAALRPLTPADERLRDVLDRGGLKASLLYVRYGPQAVTSCPFATPGDVNAGQIYLIYAIPSIIAPHLLHLFALGVVTSGILSGREGARWRIAAAIAGIVLGAAEFWYIANYDSTYNAHSTRLNEVDFIYWKLLVWRGLAIAALDGVLGWVIWLQATGRAFVTPPSATDRIWEHNKGLETLMRKTKGVGVVRNATCRDGGLRNTVNSYWIKEGEVMKDVLEQPEVLEAQRNVLRRLDVTRLAREAEAYVENILSFVRIARSSPAPQ